MKTRVLVCLSVMMSLLGLGLLPAAAQEDACYSKDGNWMTDTQKCVVSVGVRVDVDYPLEMAQYPEVAKVIDTFITDQQKSFISSYTPDYTLPAHVNNWEMNISNEIYTFSDEIQTVVFNISFYTGGAHPNSGYTTMTFDVKKGKQLMLSDLFINGEVPYDIIAKLAQEDLKTHLGDMVDPIMFDPGTDPNNHDNYKNWALTDKSIIFFFDPYQVAAYAAGPQKVEIPLTTLHTLLVPPFGNT
ncbi:MAG: DUF3298 domain-containing protein [Anaerolineaceae bacterium]|nr:DUF3298 domain-containing protein [Anaerolineaceae bacterium]